MDWHGLWNFLSNNIVFLSLPLMVVVSELLSTLKHLYSTRQNRLIREAEEGAREAEARAEESANQVRALELRNEERRRSDLPKSDHPSEYERELPPYSDGLQQQQ